MRDTKMEQAVERKKETDEQKLFYKLNMAAKEEDRRVKADKNREDCISHTLFAERKIKWAFIIAFMNRTALMARSMAISRKTKFFEKKNERINTFIHDKFHPLIISMRSKKWKAAWDVFKK